MTIQVIDYSTGNIFETNEKGVMFLIHGLDLHPIYHRDFGMTLSFLLYSDNDHAEFVTNDTYIVIWKKDSGYCPPRPLP